MAIVSAMESLDAADGAFVELSPLFHYRLAAPYLKSDGTMEIRDGLRVAASHGVCAGTLYPRKHAAPLPDPTAAAMADAQNHRIFVQTPSGARGFATVQPRADAVRLVLLSGLPVIVGFWLTDGYGELISGRVHGEPVGRSSTGHVVLAVGFDDHRSLIRIKDSRGRSFGEKGYWYLPYEFFDRMVEECWVIGALRP